MLISILVHSNYSFSEISTKMVERCFWPLCLLLLSRLSVFFLLPQIATSMWRCVDQEALEVEDFAGNEL